MLTRDLFPVANLAKFLCYFTVFELFFCKCYYDDANVFNSFSNHIAV